MASLLREKLGKHVPHLRIAQKTEANSVWVHFPSQQVLDDVQKEVDVCLWNSKTLLTRMICNYDTTEDDVEHLVTLIQSSVYKTTSS